MSDWSEMLAGKEKSFYSKGDTVDSIDKERRELKNKLSKDIACFIADGGEIQKIPLGITKEDASYYISKNNKQKGFEKRQHRFGPNKSTSGE